MFDKIEEVVSSIPRVESQLYPNEVYTVHYCMLNRHCYMQQSMVPLYIHMYIHVYNVYVHVYIVILT